MQPYNRYRRQQKKKQIQFLSLCLSPCLIYYLDIRTTGQYKDYTM